MAPRELSAEESGFRALWAGTDLDRFRPGMGTYELYPSESLPPLPADRFTGTFDWLGEPGEPVAEQVAEVDRIAASLAEAGLTLPDEFVTMLTHQNYHRALDQVSCTCCWTYLAGPFPSPVDPAARVVMFFRDQQDCVVWYLYLRPAADGSGTESFVAHSFRQLEYEQELRDSGTEQALKELAAIAEDPYGEFSWCAPGIEQFAYRFWIEGKLWFTLSGDSQDEPNPALDAYLAHYKQADTQTTL
ncbi:MAG TPA: hypothetical protein VGX23_11665 [Actinocrinis sp.]|nr:hypothetical protein [Actinocrinis sp.]